MSLKQQFIGGNIIVTSVIFGFLSWFVPKKRGLIIFYPAFEPKKYDGNLKPLFEYLSKNLGKPWEVQWISQSGKVVEDIRSKGMKASKRFGRPLFSLLRAEVIILDKNEPRLGLGKFRMIQTWHGTGFKRIALETPGLSASRLAAFRWHFRHYELIVANCPDDRARKARCFDNDNVEILGSPRNDMLLKSSPEAVALKAKLGLSADQKVVTYCPTFRDSGIARPFTPKGWKALDEALAAQDMVMLVKPHRFDKAVRVPSTCVHVRDVSPYVDDVMQLLSITDLLISDYSSISTDYVLTERPVIFYTYDADDYQGRNKRLAFDPFETLPGPFVYDEESLICHIIDQSWFSDPTYREKYDQFRQRFHSFLDDGSTYRVATAILKKIGA